MFDTAFRPSVMIWEGRPSRLDCRRDKDALILTNSTYSLAAPRVETGKTHRTFLL